MRYRSEYDKLNTMDKKNTLLSSLILEDNASSNGLTEKSSSDINSLPEAAYTFDAQYAAHDLHKLLLHRYREKS